METFTITEAKKQLGALLKRAVVGEDIGVICGADILAFRKVEVMTTDRRPSASGEALAHSSVVREDAAVSWFPDLSNLEGSGLGDGSINHDKYIYDEL